MIAPSFPAASHNPLAFALDFPTLAEARAAATEVAPALGMLKVGLELFIGTGPEVTKIGEELHLPVFLDLKLHDIPETVERAVARACHLGARAITVHASGGRAMLKRAVERAKKEGGTLDICAVTILTSLDDVDLEDLGITVTRRMKAFKPLPDDEPDVEEERTTASFAAEKLARIAYEEGVRWFVCAPSEVRALRRRLGADAVLVTPGIRPQHVAVGDQKRVATPERAVADGADWIVVGRPIRDASDRLAAARAIATAAMGARVGR